MTHRSAARQSPRQTVHARTNMAVISRRRGALSIQQVHSLIDNVKRFPCIWNSNHEEYVHRSSVATAWVEITKKVQLPEDLIRAKWKNLRDVFIKEAKRTKVTSVDEYHGKWTHFKRLWFLYRMDSSEQALSEEESSETIYDSNHEPYDVKIEPPEADVNEFEFLDTEQEVEILPEKQMNAFKNSRSDQDDVSDVLAPKRRRMNQVYSDDDCDVMFLMSLAPYFKLLKPIRRLVLRNKMQDIILKEIEASTVNGQL